MASEKLLSLVVPVYFEEEVLPAAYPRMKAAMEQTGYAYEIIFVNDGSKDGTMGILRRIAKADPAVKVLSFSRNFGHQLAVTAGMDEAKGDALIIIDADLQDPPELIPQMVKMWEQGADIVYGKRQKREGETFLKKFTAACYYRLLSSMSAYPIPLDTGDFRLIGRNVADVFLTMREHDRFLRGMSAWMGFESVPLEYVRHERAAGKTKYTLKKMLKLAVDGITGFSTKPLSFPLFLGGAVCILSLLGFIAVLICSLTASAAPWLWGLCGVFLIQGITLLLMGIQGTYLGRMFEEAKGRPLYVIAERIHANEATNLQK
ncbi:MAG: glycosyltransferase family 2 protein [Clostridia bacterium]|nr:glycosyltransferase family 2 protein [Clostridia bacterium]